MNLKFIKILGNGTTEPRINSRTEIILIQNKTVTVGRLILDDKENQAFYIEHPENLIEVDKLALQFIQSKDLTLMETENSKIILCPKFISENCTWK